MYGTSKLFNPLSRISEPLPIKLRALPQSFWQQPNQANPLPPGSVYSTLPPLPGQAQVFTLHCSLRATPYVPIRLIKHYLPVLFSTYG